VQTTPCPFCETPHVVTDRDRRDDHGKPVSDEIALMTAHFRVELDEKLKRPFELFEKRTPLRRVRRAAKAGAR
jgi:hypothetical protein